jgi:uncharacterized protein (DUF1778 family)
MALKIRKEERIEMRLPAKAKQQIEHAAQLQGRSVSDFITAAALEQSDKVIEQQKIIRLSVTESIDLAHAILNPPKPNAKAFAATQRYNAKMSA